MLLDPADAYDRLAPDFAAISERRRRYLRTVEEVIIAQAPTGSRTLLDIGAGDGSRSLRIGHAAGIGYVTLLDPSPAMRRFWPEAVIGLPLRAQDLDRVSGSFDVVLCLWNVLGHVFPASARVEALRQCGRLLSPNGRLFVDVNNRYNAAEYGWLATARRMAKDVLRPDLANGDVVVHNTMGHVFTPVEIDELVKSSGLVVQRQWNIHYGDGRVVSSRFSGMPLLQLERESSSADVPPVR